MSFYSVFAGHLASWHFVSFYLYGFQPIRYKMVKLIFAFMFEYYKLKAIKFQRNEI